MSIKIKFKKIKHDHTKLRKIEKLTGIPTPSELPAGYARSGAWLQLRGDALEIFEPNKTEPTFVFWIDAEIDNDTFEQALIMIRQAVKRLKEIKEYREKQNAPWSGSEEIELD